MDFGLAVFWSTFILIHSFGEKHLKINVLGKKKFLQCIFQRSFSADGYKQVYPTEKHFNN